MLSTGDNELTADINQCQKGLSKLFEKSRKQTDTVRIWTLLGFLGSETVSYLRAIAMQQMGAA